jgi:hypothetical protein
MPPITQQIEVSIASIFLVGVFGWALGKRHSVHLYRLWYFFSFFVCITLLIMIWAHSVNAFDKSGAATGKAGNYVLWAIKSYTDTKFEVSILSSAIFLIIVPPVITYLITGLYGFAYWKIPLRPILVFVMFSFLKFLISFAGIAVVLMPWAYYEGWATTSLTTTIFACLTTFSYVAFSFVVMFVYLDGYDVLIFMNPFIPRPLLWTANAYIISSHGATIKIDRMSVFNHFPRVLFL